MQLHSSALLNKAACSDKQKGVFTIQDYPFNYKDQGSRSRHDNLSLRLDLLVAEHK